MKDYGDFGKPRLPSLDVMPLPPLFRTSASRISTDETSPSPSNLRGGFGKHGSHCRLNWMAVAALGVLVSANCVALLFVAGRCGGDGPATPQQFQFGVPAITLRSAREPLRAMAAAAAAAGASLSGGVVQHQEQFPGTSGLTAAAADAASPRTPGGAQSPPPSRRGAGIVDLDDEGQAYTSQTCYMDTDESETCVYDGALCFDGVNPVVLVGHEPRTEPIIDS